jgi:hypothetical protein
MRSNSDDSSKGGRYRTDSYFGLSTVLPVFTPKNGIFRIPAAILTILLFTLSKSLIIPLSIALHRYLLDDPFYSNPQCLLRLVNETAPEHYAAHQFWRSINYDNSCAGPRLKAFVESQFGTFAQAEFMIWKLLAPAMFFAALATLLSGLYFGKARVTKAKIVHVV